MEPKLNSQTHTQIRTNSLRTHHNPISLKVQYSHYNIFCRSHGDSLEMKIFLKLVETKHFQVLCLICWRLINIYKIYNWLKSMQDYFLKCLIDLAFYFHVKLLYKHDLIDANNKSNFFHKFVFLNLWTNSQSWEFMLWIK